MKSMNFFKNAFLYSATLSTKLLIKNCFKLFKFKFSFEFSGLYVHFITVNSGDGNINVLEHILVIWTDLVCFIKVYQKVLGVQGVLGFQSLADLSEHKPKISNR